MREKLQPKLIVLFLVPNNSQLADAFPNPLHFRVFMIFFPSYCFAFSALSPISSLDKKKLAS